MTLSVRPSPHNIDNNTKNKKKGKNDTCVYINRAIITVMTKNDNCYINNIDNNINNDNNNANNNIYYTIMTGILTKK